MTEDILIWLTIGMSVVSLAINAVVWWMNR
jgi:hypothetical protein